jgi:hypothetical protein
MQDTETEKKTIDKIWAVKILLIAFIINFQVNGD